MAFAFMKNNNINIVFLKVGRVRNSVNKLAKKII